MRFPRQRTVVQAITLGMYTFGLSTRQFLKVCNIYLLFPHFMRTEENATTTASPSLAFFSDSSRTLCETELKTIIATYILHLVGRIKMAGVTMCLCLFITPLNNFFCWENTCPFILICFHNIHNTTRYANDDKVLPFICTPAPAIQFSGRH